MIDLSSLKAPGWQRAVAELSAPATDDRAYLLRLLSILSQIAGSRQGALWTITGQREDESAPQEPVLDMLWPAPAVEGAAPGSAVATAPDQSSVDHLAEAKAAAQSAASQRQARVFSLDQNDEIYDATGSKGYMLAVPVIGGMPNEAPIAPLKGVVTLLLDHRSRQALQTTIALVEILTGYIYTHTTQQTLRRVRSSTASLEMATRLIASMNSVEGFKAACMQLVNELCRQLAVDRVALGWAIGKTGGSARRVVKLAALSDTEHLDRRMAMIQKLEAAMEECLDQAQPVLFPPPPESGDENADAILSRAVVHAHRDLASGDARLRVGSFPLRTTDKDGEEIVGVLTIESSPAPESGQATINVETAELLQAALDLLAPVLVVRHSDDRNLALRTAASARRAAAWLVGPTHTVWKIVGVLALITSLVVTFVHTTYRIGAPMELRPRDLRTVTVPFEGILWELAPGIGPNVRVNEGDLLAELDTTRLRLMLSEAESSRFQYLKEADEATKKNDLSGAQQSQAKVEQLDARIELLHTQIDQSRLVAPISGTIVSPEIDDRLKSLVEAGTPLFQIADLSEMIAVIQVEDRDISMIRDSTDPTLPPTVGEIAPKSDPKRTIPIVVERIVPMARADQGTNAFEIRAALRPGPNQSLDGFLPGVEGQARLDGPRKSLIAIAGRRLIDQLRLWLWW